MIEPVGYRVMVKPDDVELTTPGGIVLALDENIEKHAQVHGTVVAYGSQAWLATQLDENGTSVGEPWVNVGDRVLYSKYGGKTVIDPANGEEFVMLNDVDILARIS